MNQTNDRPSESRTSSPIVRVRGLSHKYGRSWALRDVDLDLRPGEIFGLLGPNGAGKTTFQRVLLGLLRCDSGSVQILEWTARRLPQHAFASIGYVSEEQDWPSWMSLGQLIRQLAPLYPTWDPVLCERLCRRFDLVTDRSMRKLSRGQRMRARFVLALAFRPRLLVLDEPFAGLDPKVRNHVIDGLLEFTAQEHWTILLATHELSIVERLADRVGILNRGRLALVAEVESLQRRARRVQVDLSEPLPADFLWPEAWHDRQIDHRRLRFLDLAYTDGTDYRAIPSSVRVSKTRVGLEDIYLALDNSQEASR